MPPLYTEEELDIQLFEITRMATCSGRNALRSRITRTWISRVSEAEFIYRNETYSSLKSSSTENMKFVLGSIEGRAIPEPSDNCNLACTSHICS